jgi:hypothetical protein
MSNTSGDENHLCKMILCKSHNKLPSAYDAGPSETIQQHVSQSDSLTLGICARGIHTYGSQFVCLSVCLLPLYCLHKTLNLCNKMNIPAKFSPNSKGFCVHTTCGNVYNYGYRTHQGKLRNVIHICTYVAMTSLINANLSSWSQAMVSDHSYNTVPSYNGVSFVSCIHACSHHVHVWGQAWL